MDDGSPPDSWDEDVNLSEQDDGALGNRTYYSDSDNVGAREIVCDGIAFDSLPYRFKRKLRGSGLETLRALAANPKNAASILDNFTYASYCDDECVKCEVLEYVPPLALFLSQNGNDGEVKSLITSHLLPTVTRALSDDNSQVVKMAESALLSLLEHFLISFDFIEETVWPAIQSRLSKKQNADGTIGVITLVSKMAPWIGRDLSERLIVPLLEELSTKSDLGVRRVCASLYRDLCSVVTIEVSESRLVPSFLKLCCDPEWVVRQTCAEVFMSVSCKVSLSTRKRILAPAFAKLLVDRVRWVQLSAFQSLGPFITTFAEPSITSLGYNHNGELVLKHQGASFEYKLNSAKTDDKLINPGLIDFESFIMGSNSSSLEPTDYAFSNLTVPDQQPESKPSSKKEVRKAPEEVEVFNSWQFWREPLQLIDDVELDDEPNRTHNPIESLHITNDQTKNTDPTKEISSESFNKSNSTNSSVYSECWEDLLKKSKPIDSSHIVDDWSTYENASEEFVSSIFKELKVTVSKESLPLHPILGDETKPDTPKTESPVVESQNIVPQELIDHFVSMSDPMRDCAPDLATHCAYNLPAVALTLGKDNWELLKPAYETLAADRQWKVRRIVACSIHELAVIVGEDVATQDLVPIFNGFIKDLDEVRIGALKHLAHFLKLLKPAGRNSFLPRLTEFLMTDYDWNWRFREELAEQLLQSIGFFSPTDTSHHLGPVIMALLLDKVASVRKVALVLVTELVSHVSIDVNLLRSLLAELAEQFAHSSRWNRRQTFALLCSRLVKERVLSEEMFARDLLPHLLDLSWDPVANVRLAVARAAAQNILPNPYFSDDSSPHHEVLVSVLKRLQADKDRDVRYFATFIPPSSQTEHQEELK